MILRAMTSLPLVCLGLLWLYLGMYLGSDTKFLSHRGLIGGSLLLAVIPLGAAGATFWAIWRFRQLTGERAVGRLMLAMVESVVLFMWLGTVLGWGGGI